MYDYHSTIFWYRLIFFFELCIAEILFAVSLPRRNKFVYRAVGSFVTVSLFSLALPLAFNHPLYLSMIFVLIFAASVGGLFFCFEARLDKILFLAVASYTIQHIAYLLFDTIVEAVYLDNVINILGNLSPYSPESIFDGTVSSVTVIAYFTIYFIVYWLAYYLLARKIKLAQDFKVRNTYVIVLVLIVLLVVVYLNMETLFKEEEIEETLYLERIYNLLICFISLLLQFTQLEISKVTMELKTFKAIMREKKNQYKLAKETVKLINIKSHDMKYQLSQLKRDEEKRDETLNLIDSYQTYKDTGNEALDVLLTEKAITAKKHGIELDVIADGKALSFMDLLDVYSLLGNALDNAFTSVRKIKNKKKRLVFLSISRKGNIVSIKVVNPFEGDIEIKDSLPTTTKQDKENHGFGILSMQEISRKYNGTLSFTTANNLFTLSVVLIA